MTEHNVSSEQLEIVLDKVEIGQPIVLIGLMGAGKTTVGRRLAKTIGRAFVDSDAEIEAAAGCCVSDIFAIHGETIFRDLELRVITRLLENRDIVLATGGGAWMQEKVRSQIKGKAISVWLRAELNVLLDRVERRNHRPLLEAGNKRTILEQLMNDRYPVYGLADVIVDSGKGPHEEVVVKLLDSLKQYIKSETYVTAHTHA